MNSYDSSIKLIKNIQLIIKIILCYCQIISPSLVHYTSKLVNESRVCCTRREKLMKENCPEHETFITGSDLAQYP